jgi:hypothetical protein
MLNGTTGAAAVCCGMPGGNAGIYGRGGANLPGGAISIGGVQIPRTAKGLLAKIGEAIDNAIHGGDGSAGAQAGSAGGSGLVNNLNPVPFPMVNPFRPLVQTRDPIPALTAFPNRFTYKVPAVPGAEPDDEQSSLDGGFSGPTGISLPSGPSKLQTILGTIQATLPATIGALRAQPANIFPGQTYNPYASNAGGAYPGQGVTQGGVANIGAQAGAAVGNLGDTFGNIVAQHPYLILAGGAALVLLFMSPPRRR